MSTKVFFELTDTFGGEANYGWVRRVEKAKEDAEDDG